MATAKVASVGGSLICKPDGNPALSSDHVGSTTVHLSQSMSTPIGYFNQGEQIGLSAAAAAALKSNGHAT